MVFMTTNHIERLSSALIRPGRVDVRLEFTHATDDQITDFFVGFYKVSHRVHICQCSISDCCQASATSLPFAQSDHPGQRLLCSDDPLVNVVPRTVCQVDCVAIPNI